MKKIKAPKPPPKTLRTEPNNVKAPKTPLCPQHKQEMVYKVETGTWTCQVRDCKLIAFPPDSVSEGKPVLVQGELELLVIKDPDGSRWPRMLLRTIEGRTVVMDISNYLIEFEPRVEGYDKIERLGDKVMQSKSGHVRLVLELPGWVDATT